MGDARKYNWRYDVKITVEPDTDPVAHMRTKFIELIEELQQTDKDLVLVPYKAEDISEGVISDPNKLPT